MYRWFHLENHDKFLETIPAGFKRAGVPYFLPNREITPKELTRQLNQVKPDIILATGWTPLQREPYFRAIQRYCHQHNAFHVFWSFEDPLHTEMWGMHYAEIGKPDYVFTHSLNSPPIYKQIGIPSTYMPFACNPEIHRSLTVQPRYRSDIALVANLSKTSFDTFRITSLKSLLNPLINRGYDLAIWGRGWQENRSSLPFHVPDDIIRGPIPYLQVPYVYSSSKIILGVQNSPDLLTRRTWECLGTGGFLVTNHTKGVLHHFQPGTHLVTSCNPAETVSIIEKFLRKTGARQKIARAGQKEAHRSHTYALRVRSMTQAIQPYVSAKKQQKRYSFFTPRLKQEIRPQLNFTRNIPDHQGVLGQYLSVGRDHRSTQQVYLWFNLYDPCLRSRRVHSAKLKLFLSSPLSSRPRIYCHRVQSPWNQISLQHGPPPKRSEQPIAQTQIRSTFSNGYPYRENWYSFDLTPLVRAWLAGTLRNDGLCLRVSDSDVGIARFPSTRWKGQNKHVIGWVYYRRFLPRLEIIYENQDPIYMNSWSGFKE